MTTPETTRYSILANDSRTRDPRFLTWLEDQGVAPKWTFEIEVAEDQSDMVVRQYAKSPTGHKYLIFSMGTSEVAKDEPTTVPLKSPCPITSASQTEPPAPMNPDPEEVV